jgi:hypothetical protein
MSQSDLQVTKSCGYTGPRWSRNFAEHLNWCQSREALYLTSEDYQRRAELADCKSQPVRAWNACPGEPPYKLAEDVGGGRGNVTEPHISASAPGGNTFVLTGSGFTPGAKVIVRVVNSQLQQIYVDTHGNIPFAADATGEFTFTLVGLCVQQGTLYFSVTDGRKVSSTVDITGNLWSNTVPMSCV